MKYRNNISKIFITFLVLTFLPFSSTAQNLPFGLKGGLNLSSLSVEDANDSNLLPGFYGGVWTKIVLSENFGIQPELLYSSQGVKATYDEEFLGIPVADGETKLRLNYINLPVYLNYKLSEDFRFFLGPYLGFLLNARMETDADILDFLSYENSDEVDIKEFSSIDAGISGGLGFELKPFVFGFNYNLGLIKVAADESRMERLIGEAKNTNIQVFAGVYF